MVLPLILAGLVIGGLEGAAYVRSRSQTQTSVLDYPETYPEPEQSEDEGYEQELTENKSDYETWQRIDELPQTASVHNPQDGGFTINSCAEGGRLDFLGVQLIGLEDACYRMAESLKVVWADAEARQFVEGTVHTIFCIRLQSSYGIAILDEGLQGFVLIDPYTQEAVGRASTIFHEALHLHPDYNDHNIIYPMQAAFVQRNGGGNERSGRFN